MKTRLNDYSMRLKLLKSFPASLFVGIFLGIVFAVILAGLGNFLAGVVLGVILKELFDGAKVTFEEWRKTQPLRALLGPIATEECYIFFSSYHRDMSRPDEFKLERWDSALAKEEILIRGPDLVLGEGDALALSLVQSLLACIPKKPDLVFVERGDQQATKWGINSFCIGVHNIKTRVILSKFEKTFFVFDNNYAVISPKSSTGYQG